MKNKKLFSRYFNLTFTIFQAYLISIVTTLFIIYICFLLKIRFDRIGTIMFLIIALAICFIISVIITDLMTKKYKKVINDTSKCFKQLAKGDFTGKIAIDSNNVFVNDLIDNINKIIEELNSVTLLKKDFIKNFSHEFKTPIVSIKGFSEILCNDTTLSEEEKMKYYQIIRDESTRLANLANMTLLLSKLNSDSIEIKKEVLFIDESIEESTLLLYNQMEEKHINVDINLDHIQVIASKELIKEVWINILNNAIKYTNEYGEINIYSTILDDGYLFSFKDNGIGMNDEIKEHIFDEYYQGNTTNKNQGIGLGLSICKKIIELHNWEITVTSELGKGTTFNIFIPKEK